jgi:CelD/BcsL family acetyltransferase involved in cellulose biosynthesis
VSTPRSSGETDMAARRLIARLHTSLATVETAWRSLEADGLATAFQLFSWSSVIDRTLVSTRKASLAVVELSDVDTGQTVMLFPMIRIQRFPYSELTWLDLGVNDYAAPIWAPGVPIGPDMIVNAWGAAKGALPGADLVRISRIPARISAGPNPLLELPHCRRMEMQSFEVVLDSSPDIMLRRLGHSSTVREMRRRRRKLAERGAVRFTHARTPGEIDQIFDALLAQRRQRFKAMGRFDLLEGKEFADFYRSAARDGLDGGPARLFGLSVGDEWVATLYGLVHKDAFYMVIPTMAEEDWRKFAPGLQLIMEVMEWARAQGVARFDFSIGHQPYKTNLGGRSNDLFEIYDPLSLRGRAVMLIARLASASKTWLQRRSALFHVLREWRRWLRRQFQPQ